MIDRHSQTRTALFALFVMCFAMPLVLTSCLSNESKAKKAIEEYMKGQGATNITMDLFYSNKNSPDKAYASATITYNFASSSGNPQREFLGFILARDGDGWRIEKNSGYTKEEDQAARFLAGGK
jgi:hypothetical protein